MRGRIRFVSLVAVMAALVACGGSSGGSGTAGRSPTHSSPATASPPQLSERLLTAADVGPGWQAGEPINPQDLAAFAQLPCDRTLDPALAKRLTAVAGVQFSPADRSYKHVIELVAAGPASRLAADLQSLFTAIQSCRAGAGVTVRALDLPALGDQSRGFAATQKSPQAAAATLSLRTAYVRVGSHAVLVGVADFQAGAKGTSTISDKAYVALVQKAVANLTR